MEACFSRPTLPAISAGSDEAKDLPERKIPGHDPRIGPKRLKMHVAAGSRSVSTTSSARKRSRSFRVVAADPGALHCFVDRGRKVLPISRVMSLAERVPFQVSRMARRPHSSWRARSAKVVFRKVSKVSDASCSLASICEAVSGSNVCKTSPVAGLIDAMAMSAEPPSARGGRRVSGVAKPPAELYVFRAGRLPVQNFLQEV